MLAVAVNRATGGGGQSQAMSQASLPSGTASSQPPRTQLTEAEIEAILVCTISYSKFKSSTLS